MIFRRKIILGKPIKIISLAIERKLRCIPLVDTTKWITKRDGTPVTNNAGQVIKTT